MNWILIACLAIAACAIGSSKPKPAPCAVQTWDSSIWPENGCDSSKEGAR